MRARFSSGFMITCGPVAFAVLLLGPQNALTAPGRLDEQHITVVGGVAEPAFFSAKIPIPLAFALSKAGTSVKDVTIPGLIIRRKDSVDPIKTDQELASAKVDPGDIVYAAEKLMTTVLLILPPATSQAKGMAIFVEPSKVEAAMKQFGKPEQGWAEVYRGLLTDPSGRPVIEQIPLGSSGGTTSNPEWKPGDVILVQESEPIPRPAWAGSVVAINQLSAPLKAKVPLSGGQVVVLGDFPMRFFQFHPIKSGPKKNCQLVDVLRGGRFRMEPTPGGEFYIDKPGQEPVLVTDPSKSTLPLEPGDTVVISGPRQIVGLIGAVPRPSLVGTQNKKLSLFSASDTAIRVSDLIEAIDQAWGDNSGSASEALAALKEDLAKTKPAKKLSQIREAARIQIDADRSVVIRGAFGNDSTPGTASLDHDLNRITPGDLVIVLDREARAWPDGVCKKWPTSAKKGELR